MFSICSCSGRQRPIQPIFLLAAWGRHSPRWRRGVHPRGDLSRSSQGRGASVSNSSGILQQTVCPRNSEYIQHLLVSGGMTTEALQYVRLAKMYRVFNSLDTRRAATDSARFSLAAWGGGTAHAGDALPSRCAPFSARGGVASVSIWNDNLQKILLGKNSENYKPKWLRKQSRQIACG